MNIHMVETEKNKIQRRILSYLIEHPNAQDTLTGIVEWWLMEQELRDQTEIVMQTLSDLVQSGLLAESRILDSEVSYRLNLDREEVRTFLSESEGASTMPSDSMFDKRGENTR